jgi:hypothetical protein
MAINGDGPQKCINGDGPQYITYYKRDRAKIVAYFDLKVPFL